MILLCFFKNFYITNKTFKIGKLKILITFNIKKNLAIKNI